MRRVALLAALLGVGSMSIAVAAYQQAAAAPQPKEIAVEKLKDNLFVFRGANGVNSGGNTAVFVTDTGVVVVDTKIPGWGKPILDKIRELTDKPVTTIINTHTHYDHVSGNVEFPATVDIVTHENTRVNMQTMKPPTGITPPPPNVFPDNPGKGMPNKTFKDKMSIGKGNDRIDLYYFGRGHTNGDAWVVFPAQRVAHAGDIFARKDLPLLDGNNGGSGVAIGNTLAKAADSLKQVDTIITGHSTQMTLADLREYAAFNKEFLAAVQEAKKAGKSVDDIAASWQTPSKYSGYGKPDPARLKSNVEVIFKELSKPGS